MKIDRALKLKDQMVQRIKDIYSTAEICGLSSSQINERVNSQVYSVLTEKKAPQWAISFVKGYEKCVIDNLYRYKLVFGVWYGGVFYSTHRDREDYYEKCGISPSEFNLIISNENKPGHYWCGNLKPYFNGDN